MKEIQLTRGKVALVDDKDFDRVNQFNWNARVTYGLWYACRWLPGGKGKCQYLHQFIFPGIDQIDHIDGDGLNNQSSNLRPANDSQNQANRKKKMAGCVSQFKGVSWRVNRGHWIASIRLSNYRQYLGCYESEIDAAHAYDYAAKIYFGEFARLNFPE